jgi:hypothetical protein
MLSGNGDNAPKLKVFFSYSHKDSAYRERLGVVLAHLERTGMVDAWYDGDLRAGDKWDPAIKANLDRADIVLFLVSWDFMASGYIIERELERAFQRKRAGERVQLIPIVVKPVKTKTLNGVFEGLQAIPKDDHENLKPVAKWGLRDDAYVRIYDAVEKIAEEQRAAAVQAVAGTPTSFAIPQRSAYFQGREALLERVEAEFDVCEESPCVSLVGEGGVGKTGVAVEYCWRRRQAYGHVVWLEAEQEANLKDAYAQAARAIGELPLTDQKSAKDAFLQWLTDHDDWLLVFNNAVDLAAVTRLLPGTWRGHVLVTSRQGLWRDLGPVVPVRPLGHEDSVRYLLARMGSSDTASADEIAMYTRGMPRAMVTVVGQMEAEDLTLGEYVAKYVARAEATGEVTG